jgi:hypothetical protein
MKTNRTRGLVGLVLVMLALAVAVMLPQAASAAFTFTDLDARILDATEANEDTRAGAHPFRVNNVLEIPLGEPIPTPIGQPIPQPIGHMRDIIIDMPAGFVGNPQVLPTCKYAQLRLLPDQCPSGSFVGEIRVWQPHGAGASGRFYNMVPEPGAAAQFTAEVAGAMLNLRASLRPDDYGVRLTALDSQTGLAFHRVVSHMLGTANNTPFLTNPTSCSEETPLTRVTANSWENPGKWETITYEHPQFTDCEILDYQASLAMQPAVDRAGVPSGYTIELSHPLHDTVNSRAMSHLKDAVVTFPEGVRLNPSAGIGLSGCSPAEIGLKTDSKVVCPQSSAIGSVKIETPVLAETLEGKIYQAKPFDNPFDSLMAVYLVASSPERGVTLKIPGEVSLDPVTGQITSTFENNPQQPFTKLTLQLKGGDRAVLLNPSECGSYTTEGSLSPWSGNPAISVKAPFSISKGCDAVNEFKPDFAGGSSSPVAGAATSFAMAVKRGQTDREFKTIQKIKLPEGLLGKVGSVPLCAGVQADAGTCPEASKVGHVQVSLGGGSNPLWVPEAGKEPTGVYLTGPYKGAPYGLSIKVPAQAGPFDLGTVVVRSALHVDERTTEITTGIDETRLIGRDGQVTEVLPGELPRIIEGITLNQRELRVILDRDDFIVNPTSCAPKQISAEIHSQQGDKVGVSDRFRAVDCAKLGFAPRFSARILDKGRKSTLRSFHPRTRFTVVPRKGDANIAGARVVLPSSTLLDQSNIGTTCTRAQMAERNCPEASIVGYAKAWSPLLNRALEGPVYLAANGGVRPLPDLAAVLDGEIRVVLQGEIATQRGGGKARLQNTFRVVPDAPVERFELTMRGGANRGLLVNSTDLCRSKERGSAVFFGQNGRSHRLNPRIATTFKGCGKVRRQAARRKAARRAAARAVARSLR